MQDNHCFPENFLWGAATSAYQIEGSPLADGAGPSIWHRFSRMPGRIHDDDTGDMACDHYRRFEDDVRLMKELGLQAYRFSIAWGRVLPEGRGRVNPAGLDFYQRLIDALLEQGIQPFVTLYHWDLPAALDDRGGWLNRDCAAWFADYAQILFRALDDRVQYWATLNEPWVSVDAGYLHGVHAPGHASLAETPLAAHNLLRAHATAVQAYRAEGRHRIGLVVNLEPKYPISLAPEDRAATVRAHAYMNRWYLDPVFFGTYPKVLSELFGADWPNFMQADLDHIRQPVDFLGVNYYTRSVVRDDPQALLVRASRVRQDHNLHTAVDWEVHPQGLVDTLQWVKRRYGDLPLFLTENGAAFEDPEVIGGRVEDPLRLTYLREHLKAAYTAIASGVNLQGYFVWSLLDNLEWCHGYSKRFGIVHVDYATQRRIPKSSGQFYARVIRSRGEALWEEEG